MNRSVIRIVGGILLVVVGVLSLLSSMGVFAGGIDLFWAFLFGASGALFMYVFLTNRANWWAIIPGFALIGIGLTIALELFLPQTRIDWGGILVVGGIGLAFGTIYFIKREHWWAPIPGGLMLTLALMIGLTPALESIGLDSGGFFLVGLALTFGVIAFLPSLREQTKWAFIPAAVLLLIGLPVMIAASAISQFIWPVGLIVAGLYLVFRVFRQQGSSSNQRGE